MFLSALLLVAVYIVLYLLYLYLSIIPCVTTA